MLIEIETSEDQHDCETCGSTWAEGGTVKIDGKVVIEAPPHAHCYDVTNYDPDELLVMALKKIGCHVVVDGAPYHVSCHNDDYHGDAE